MQQAAVNQLNIGILGAAGERSVALQVDLQHLADRSLYLAGGDAQDNLLIGNADQVAGEVFVGQSVQLRGRADRRADQQSKKAWQAWDRIPILSPSD